MPKEASSSTAPGESLPLCKLNGARTDEGLAVMEGLSREHVSRLGLGDICLHDTCSGVHGGRGQYAGAGCQVAGAGVCRVREQTREKDVG